MFTAAIFEPLIDLSNDRQIVLLDLSAVERQPRPVKFGNQPFEYAASVGLDVIAGQIVAEIADAIAFTQQRPSTGTRP